MPAGEKVYLLDMFPYPSGSGLHVGHPLGFIGTDVLGRYLRMTGRTVLHTMGFDAFGLPAEQYAVQTGTHPRKTTEENIQRYKAQLRQLGLAHDERRSVATTDVEFYRWTQWIFLQIYNSWYDGRARARPIAELEAEFAAGHAPDAGRPPVGRADRRPSSAGDRLPPAGLHLRGPRQLVPRPGHGAGQRGGHRGRPQRPGQLPRVPPQPEAVDDADHRLRRPAGRRPGPAGLAGFGQGHAAQLDRPLRGRAGPVPVVGDDRRSRSSPPARTPCSAPPTWCWPPSTRWSTPSRRPRGRPTSTRAGRAARPTPPTAIAEYRAAAARKSDLDRQENKDKTGVFTGAFATNPVNGSAIPVFVADYVLMGYGTGAIMAVPGQDQRDWDFATTFGLPIIRTVEPSGRVRGRGVHRRGPGDQLGERRGQPERPGRRRGEARRSSTGWWPAARANAGSSTSCATGCSPGSATGASRSRSSGTTTGPIPVPEDQLPVELPEIDDYSPRTYDPDDANTEPEPPLSRATEWLRRRATG